MPNNVDSPTAMFPSASFVTDAVDATVQAAAWRMQLDMVVELVTQLVDQFELTYLPEALHVQANEQNSHSIESVKLKVDNMFEIMCQGHNTGEEQFMDRNEILGTPITTEDLLIERLRHMNTCCRLALSSWLAEDLEAENDQLKRELNAQLQQMYY
ncbi:hypothetical protein OPT61_g5069 [Boeremia exigua]|uniref:Uncharacterized protein n=1 Tax=Boeremia exigua TaxID=749465 RepID=A0ACC2IBS5_9PLEO|nr:hypothetical protein OPT61_g5069 [Boeremia exigua]